VSLKEFVESIVTGSPEEMAGVAPSPSSNHLFTISEENLLQQNME